MKDKPHRHRLQNTFRFQGFQARVKSIKVSSRKYLLQKFKDDSDFEIEFVKSLQKWQELNLTKGFKDFRSDIEGDISSLSQLLHNEKRIVQAFENHLKEPDSLSLSPLLHALVAFATDLSEVFFKNYFHKFVNILKKHLNTSCHETIENIFVCLVSLFTVGQKSIRGDIVKLYHEEDYAKLLSKSYPWYINDLAAQSLGFLVRKLPNQRNFFKMAFGKLKKDSSQKEGVGRLLFYTIKSDVTRRLHSSTPKTLSLILDILKEDTIPLQTSVEAIEYCFHKLSEHITSKSEIGEEWKYSWKEDSHLVWGPLWQTVSSTLSNKDENFEEYLNALLQVIFKLVAFKYAILVLDPEVAIKSILNIIDQANSNDIFKNIYSILTKLILSSHHSLSPSTLKSVLDKFLCMKISPEIIFAFIEQLTNYPHFDDEILPNFLKYVDKFVTYHTDPDAQKKILTPLVNIILSRQSPIMAEGDSDNWVKYLLNFAFVQSTSNSCITNLLDYLLSKGLSEDFMNVEEIILCCICVPHIVPLDYEDFIPSLFYILNDSINLCLVEDNDDNLNETSKNSLLCLIGYIVETIYHLLPSVDFLDSFSEINLFRLLTDEKNKENVYILKATHICMLALSSSSFHYEKWITFQKVYELLSPLLCSSKPLVRLLVCKIFLKFKKDPNNIFLLMVEAESVPITPYEFKERLRFLSKLDYDHIQEENEDLKVAALLFLIGQLHINFKEIWPPVQKHISSFASNLKEDVFWPLWMKELRRGSEFSLKQLCNASVHTNTLLFKESLLSGLDSVSMVHPGYSNLPTKSSYLHFRDQLWQTMGHFPDVCERKNRDIVTLFFDFLYQEYFPADVNVAPTQDISKVNINEDNGDETLEDENYDNEDLSNELESDPRIRKAPTSTLCKHISIFAKFHNLKSCHKSKHLLEIFKEFLPHPYLPLQKLSLDAIMAYNYKYLSSYKDSLYRILDDKTFREEITLFSIDGSNEDDDRSLKVEHRNDFMPILMRILYGKMLYKTGSNSSGKGKSSFRKGVVIRFLAGANESELNTFLDQTFDVFINHLDGSSLEVVSRVMSNTDPKKVVPLKRIHGAFRTLETIIDKLGNLVVHKRGFFLKVLLFILSTTVALLEKNKENISQYYYSLLKKLRQMSMLKLVSFFQIYEDYAWSSEELEALYLTGVWPILPRFPNEGIYNPTSLMKLFLCWAENPRYHVLLARFHPSDYSLTPLPYILKLIQHPKCSNKVINASFTLVERLLSIPENQEEVSSMQEIAQESTLDATNIVREKGLNDLTFGESLVVMHLDGILQAMKEKLSNGALDKRELSILIHVADWIQTKGTGEEFLSLIVPVISRNKIKDEERVCHLLQVCSNLLKIVEDPKVHIKIFLHMFSVLDGRHPRESLSHVISTIAHRIPDFSDLSDWCNELNSWNLKMADEIDFETRLNCYKKINIYLESCTEVKLEECIFLIINNFWSLKQISDTAIRDSSFLSLQKLFKMLSRLHLMKPTPISRLLVEEHLLPQIKLGLKHVKEKVRDDMIMILQAVATHCHNIAPKLQDLYNLTNQNDKENDFLLNMCHIQRHRRGRAMNKLCEKIKSKTLILQKETIVEFLLPLTSSFLFKDEYSKDDYLMTGVVSTIGTLAKELSWAPYQNLLKFYLNLMSQELKFLKLGVGVLESIIDAFHENLEFADIADEKKDLEAGDAQSRIKNSTQTQKSNKVYIALTMTIIPQIQKTLSSPSLRDKEHKVNKKQCPEDRDIKRIPLALALVKLLKKLPQKVLDDNVDGVLMKLITFLKSRASTVREQARNMLVKVMMELGGKYFPLLVRDMKTLLNRGFHSHVLVYTLHAVLSEMQTTLMPEDVGSCLSDIMELCIQNLFGEQAEEKEVAQIVSKYIEAKAERSLDIIGLTSQIISAEHLEQLMIPLKQSLETQDKKIINKVASCLQKAANGLERNCNILLNQKTVFIFGLLNDKINQLCRREQMRDEEPSNLVEIPDSYILLPEPRKAGLKPKISLKDTNYIITEFSLKLFYLLLRHHYFDPDNPEHCSYLDPFVLIVKKCLQAEYPEISVNAVHIFSWMLKYPLPSLKKQMQGIVGQMFVILNEYSSSNLTKGKIYELVQLVFKTLSLILKEYPDIPFEDDHLIVLIHYARDNIEDYDQHHSTFTILEALIHRKIETAELHAVMASVKELSITSSNVNMLDQARCCYFKYIMNYPKRKKQHISTLMYFLSNLAYSIPKGRLSSILMINDILSKYPQSLFTKNIELHACSRIIEELACQDLKDHKRLLQKALRTLYLKSERKQNLIDLCLKSFDSKNSSNRSEEATRITMAAQAFCTFLDVPNNAHPTSLFPSLAPKVVNLLSPARFKVDSAPDDDLIEEQQLCALDSSLNSLLELLSKMMEVYMTQNQMDLWNEHVDRIMWDNIKEHLLYPNLQSRVLASSIISSHFSKYSIEKGQLPILPSSPKNGKSLVLDLCEQLATESSSDKASLKQLSLIVVRNLIYLIRLSEKMCINPLADPDDKNSEAEEEIPINESNPLCKGALYVLEKVSRFAYRELRLHPKTSTLCREAFINLIAGVVVILKGKFVESSSLVTFVLNHIVRELSDKNLPECLSERTKELSSLLKETMGLENYNEESVKAQLKLSKKKLERRAREKERVITNPQVAMKKRTKKHEAKKVAKKRKFAELKLKPNKKKKLKNMAIVS